MNNKKILEKWFSVEQIEKLLSCAQQLTTIADQAEQNTIVFYKMTSPTSIDLFKKRIENKKALFYIIGSEFEIKDFADSKVVNLQDFELLQETFCKLIYPINKEVKLIGVTGTNGKTSVVNYCAHLLSLLTIPSICIGTMGVGNGIEVFEEDAINTTPSFVDLMALIFKYQRDYKYFFFEYSSHALAQRRLLNIKIDVAAWTSFSQDHLDFHKTMDEYFQAKMLIFSHLKSDQSKVVVPMADDFSYQIMEDQACKEHLVLTKSLNVEKSKVHFVFHQGFNKSNLEISLMILSQLGFNQIFETSLESLMPPAGRFEIIEKSKKYSIVDYAHTPDALEKLLLSVMRTFPNYKICLVFGCGGNRDAKKRPLMGHVATKVAHKIFITNDNPRNEVSDQIAKDIMSGITNSHAVEIILDRKLAIETALRQQDEKTVVVVAGKGHESYQEINGQRFAFSDKQVIENFYFNAPGK